MLRGVCAPRPPSLRAIEHVTRCSHPPVQTRQRALQADVCQAGERRNNCVKTSLKRLILRNPAASATFAIDRFVSRNNWIATSTRRVCATATGDAPTCSAKSRRS
jgi:hypothetical protein